MKINHKIVLSLALLTAVGTGCKKSYLDTTPTDKVSEEVIFETTKGAYVALNGIHSLMISDKLFNNSHDNWGIKAYDLNQDVMGNDMVCSGSNYDWFDFSYKYTWTESATYRGPYQAWIFFYRIINNANKILDQIDHASGPQEEIDDVKGQALAYRTFAYLRLTDLFQQTFVGNENKPGVPLYTSGSTAESSEGRGTLQQNFDQMRTDIENAVTLLQNAPLHSQKSHISVSTAHGLAARVYLVTNEWEKAADHAALAYADYPLMSSSEYTSGFNDASNSEWMWASSYTNTQYDDMGILSFISFMDPDAPGYASVGATRKITKALYDQIPASDIRKQMWAANLGQQKFKTQDPEGFVCDYLYMRASEMYLIEAEAAAHFNTSRALDALTDLMSYRDPSYVAPAASQTAILDEVYKQRRIELWGEGFGRSDIMRLKQPLNRPSGSGNHKASVAQVMTLPAGDARFIFPIPQREIDSNPKMTGADQNP